jgi:SMC interacting uncharacterized protein involved in chromosome segregation
MTTDHEAAATGKVGLVDRFIDWLTYDPHAALKRANEEIARLKTQVLGHKANWDMANNEVERLKGGNETLGVKFDGAKYENEKLTSRVAFLEGELHKTMKQMNDMNSQAGQIAEGLRKEIACKDKEISGLTSNRDALCKILDVIKEQYDLVDEFPDDDIEYDDDDDDFDEDDESYCTDCGCPMDECEC